MPDDTKRIERRCGRRTGPPKIALCGHEVAWFPGAYRKRCDECSRRDPRSCEVCGIDITQTKADARFCDSFCRNIRSGAQLTGPRDRRVCALPECAVEFEPAWSGVGCCTERHGKQLYNRESRAAGRQLNPWNDRRRNNAQARRARMKGARTGGSVFLSEIVARDGSDCWLCGLPVDLGLAWPDRDSKSVDHIIPLSKGGIHDPSNCALAHMGCNAAKGDRVA